MIQTLSLLTFELPFLFFLVCVLHALGLKLATGGSKGRAIQTSADRGGGGGSLRYASSSLPNRSSSLTKALGFPEFEAGHIEYPQVEYGSATVAIELQLSRREDEHDADRVIAIGRLVNDPDGEVDGVRL